MPVWTVSGSKWPLDMRNKAAPAQCRKITHQNASLWPWLSGVNPLNLHILGTWQSGFLVSKCHTVSRVWSFWVLVIKASSRGLNKHHRSAGRMVSTRLIKKKPKFFLLLLTSLSTHFLPFPSFLPLPSSPPPPSRSTPSLYASSSLSGKIVSRPFPPHIAFIECLWDPGLRSYTAK